MVGGQHARIMAHAEGWCPNRRETTRQDYLYKAAYDPSCFCDDC